MPRGLTMKFTKYCISVILLVIILQLTESADVHRQKKAIAENAPETRAISITERDVRGIRDIWIKIRASAIQSWNYIKSMAEKTKDNIKLFMENVKEQAIELKNSFEKKLDELKIKLNGVVNDIYGTGELVKQCLKKEQDNLEGIMKEIMAKMSECVAAEISNVMQISSDVPQPALNETKFIRQLDDRMRLCERDMANIQECLCEIREDVFNAFTDMENNILKTQYDSRNIADDIKGTLVTCSLNNIIDATNLISIEIVDIAKCVLDAKEAENLP